MDASKFARALSCWNKIVTRQSAYRWKQYYVIMTSSSSVEEVSKRHHQNFLLCNNSEITACTQWSNCGGTRRNSVPLPFLERRSPSLHDHCGPPTSEFKPEQYVKSWLCKHVSADDIIARARSAEQLSSSYLSCI